MRKALRYRLFGMGKLPTAPSAAAGRPGVLLGGEGLPTWNRVQALRIPAGGYRMASGPPQGAVVILPDRLLASIGRQVIADTA